VYAVTRIDRSKMRKSIFDGSSVNVYRWMRDSSSMVSQVKSSKRDLSSILSFLSLARLPLILFQLFGAYVRKELTADHFIVLLH